MSDLLVTPQTYTQLSNADLPQLPIVPVRQMPVMPATWCSAPIEEYVGTTNRIARMSKRRQKIALKRAATSAISNRLKKFVGRKLNDETKRLMVSDLMEFVTPAKINVTFDKGAE